MDAILDIQSISAGYGDLKVLFDVSLHVNSGEIVSLVGSNGAGKTTLLRIVSGFVPVTSGRVFFNGKDLLQEKTFHRSRLGIAHIPQGRGILNALTVQDNLVLGLFDQKKKVNPASAFEEIYEMFPKLMERRNQQAGSLSGGEQQMLAIGRSLLQNPKLLMLDEPSLGLSPKISEQIFEIISVVARRGVSVLIVEQNLVQALSIANRGYVLETGQIVREGPADILLRDNSIKAAYLGI